MPLNAIATWLFFQTVPLSGGTRYNLEILPLFPTSFFLLAWADHSSQVTIIGHPEMASEGTCLLPCTHVKHGSSQLPIAPLKKLVSLLCDSRRFVTRPLGQTLVVCCYKHSLPALCSCASRRLLHCPLECDLGLSGLGRFMKFTFFSGRICI